jgi:hypothetical protein
MSVRRHPRGTAEDGRESVVSRGTVAALASRLRSMRDESVRAGPNERQ